MTGQLLHLPSTAREASELEGMLIGAVLAAKEPARLMDLAGITDAHFTNPRMRLCWSLLRRMVAAKMKVINCETVFAFGMSRVVFADADRYWLQQLEAANLLEGDDAFAQVCGELRRLVHSKKIAAQLRDLGSRAESNFNPGKLTGDLDGLQRELASDYTPTQLGSVDVVAFAEDMAKPAQLRTQQYFPTGVKVLDEIMIGWAPSLNVVLGDPGIGKSALMGSILEAELRAGVRVGFFGLEEGLRWLTRRIICKHVGIALSDLGRKELTEDQQTIFDALVPQLHGWFEKLWVSPRGRTPIDEVCRRATSMIVQYGVERIYLDHIGEVEHYGKPGEQNNWAVARSYQRLRDLAGRHNVPVIALAHRSTSARDRTNGPPRPFELGLTGEGEKMVRRMLGLWRKDGELRATVIKNNEGKPGVTAAFELVEDAAMVTAEGGRVVNLAEERRKEQEVKDAEKLKKSDSMFERNRKRAQAAKEKEAKEKAKREAEAKEAEEKAAKEKPQLQLIDGGQKPPDDPRDA